MASGADPFSILSKTSAGEKPKPQYDPGKKVRRYWAGKAPEWAQEEDEEIIVDYTGGRQASTKSTTRDRRLERLQEATSVKEDALQRRRRIHQAMVVSAEGAEEEEAAEKKKSRTENDLASSTKKISLEDEPAKDDEEAEEDDATRRQRLREKARLMREQQDEEIEKQSEESESEYTTEYETDSDYEDENRATLLKPVFVPRNKRDTLEERDRIEQEERDHEEAEKKRKEELKTETRRQVIETIKRNEEEALNTHDVEEDLEMPSDDDDVDEKEEFEKWKIRELTRVKREREEQEARDKERRDLERRRTMTDAERRKDDQAHGIERFKKKEKTQYSYMQKYYHEGAYFTDMANTKQGEVLKRDFNMPVGEEGFDKSVLPKIMQRRRGEFGMAGQTKHTTLKDMDTSQRSGDRAYDRDKKMSGNYRKQMAGLKSKDDFNRPSKKRKVEG